MTNSKFQKRAETLYNHPDNEKNNKNIKSKIFDLGKSMFDKDDDTDDANDSISIIKKVPEKNETSKQSLIERRRNRSE